MTRERALELAETAIEVWHIVGGRVAVTNAILAAVAEEREACAQIAVVERYKWNGVSMKIADKIRERGIPIKVGA